MAGTPARAACEHRGPWWRPKASGQSGHTRRTLTRDADRFHRPTPSAARSRRTGRRFKSTVSQVFVFTSRNENETQEAVLRSEGAACEIPTQRSATFRVRQKGWSLPFEGGKGETQSYGPRPRFWGKPRVTDLDRAFAGPSPTPAKKRGPARWAKVPGRRQPPPAPPRPGRARSGTCEGPGVGLPALLAAPRGPHVDPVRLARLQARQDGAVPLPGDRGVPGLPVGGGVAHHVFVYGSPDGLPGDRHRVFCHSISDHIGRAINFFIKTHEEEKLEKPRGRTRSQRRHDPVHLGDLVPEPTPCRKVLPPPVTGRHPASA